MLLSPNFAISFLFLLISTTSHLRLFNAEGRKLEEQTPKNSEMIIMEEKTTWRVQIGSKPPRCERRCGGCGHCEAVQVPTNPQTRNSWNASAIVEAHRGDDDSSNYKPMSWKCKCGNLVFNP